MWYFRALFNILRDDTGPPILVWRETNEENTSWYTTGKYVMFENTQRNENHTFCNRFVQCNFGIIKIVR